MNTNTFKELVENCERVKNLSLRDGKPFVEKGGNDTQGTLDISNKTPVKRNTLSLYTYMQAQPDDYFWNLKEGKALIKDHIALQLILQSSDPGIDTNDIKSSVITHLTGTHFKKENSYALYDRLRNNTDSGKVTLQHDPNNVHDNQGSAINVLDSLGKNIGFIPAALAPNSQDQINTIILRNINQGFLVTAQIAKLEISDKGVAINLLLCYR